MCADYGDPPELRTIRIHECVLEVESKLILFDPYASVQKATIALANYLRASFYGNDLGADII